LNLENHVKNLDDSLERINYIYQNEEILTECIKSHEGITLYSETYGPFEKGKKYRLKLFIARVFIKNDVLKVEQSQKCDSIDVQRYAIAESDDLKIVRRSDEFFLNKIKEFKIFMEKDVDSNSRPKIDLDRYKSYTVNVINSRLEKLLRLAQTDLSLDDEQRLTRSEKILYEYLSQFIKSWRFFFLTN